MFATSGKLKSCCLWLLEAFQVISQQQEKHVWPTCSHRLPPQAHPGRSDLQPQQALGVVQSETCTHMQCFWPGGVVQAQALSTMAQSCLLQCVLITGETKAEIDHDNRFLKLAKHHIPWDERCLHAPEFSQVTCILIFGELSSVEV